jgi:hypothetical protein
MPDSIRTSGRGMRWPPSAHPTSLPAVAPVSLSNPGFGRTTPRSLFELAFPQPVGIYDIHEEAQKAVDYLADKVVAMKYEVLSEHKVAHASASGLIFGAIAGGFQCPDQSP